LTHGKQQGYRAVPLYFQEADGEVFASLDPCLRWFCATIAEELALPDRLDEFWQNPALGSKRKCTNYIQQRLLSEMVSPLVLGLDEVDLVFKYPNVAQDFFALLRTWHERGKNEPGWQKLRLVIVHSKEVYIPLDMHQSPFNVGVPI
jgi:AAA-like domain